MNATCLFCGPLKSSASTCPTCGQPTVDRNDPASAELIAAADGLARQSAIRGNRAIQIWFGLFLANLMIGPFNVLNPIVLGASLLITFVLVQRALIKKAPRLADI